MLTFDELQEANRVRGAKWGESPGIDFRGMELGGEAGELLEAVLDAAHVAARAGKAMNAVKKLSRHEKGMPGGNPDLEAVADEIGDVIISCSLLANDLGINLGEATVNKFNKTSVKHGFSDRLPVVVHGCPGCEQLEEHDVDCPVWLGYHEGMNKADRRVPAISRSVRCD